MNGTQVSPRALITIGAVFLAGAGALFFQGYWYFEPSALPVVLTTILLSLAVATYSISQSIQKSGRPFWNREHLAATANVGVPLFIGTLACIYFYRDGQLTLVAPTMLLFYGLSLFKLDSTSSRVVQLLAVISMLLGVVAFYFLRWQVVLWGLGFGGAHLAAGIWLSITTDHSTHPPA